MSKGSITTEYTVWCVKCDEWYQISADKKKTAIQLFKTAYGWKINKGKWCCQNCGGKEDANGTRYYGD